MRASITWNSDEHEGYVGSNDRVLIYQEFGTSRGIPPRPVLGLAGARKEDEIHKLAERAVGEAVSSLGEIFRGLRHTGHLLKKTAEGLHDLVHEDDNNDR
jgi:hypothetical protein